MKNDTVLIAIDPGASGGIAVLNTVGEVIAVKMPDTPRDVFDVINGAIKQAHESAMKVFCYMELVGGYIGEEQPGYRMFNFGKGYGNLEGFLIALGVPFELVSPRKWQQAVGAIPVGRQKAIIMDSMTPSQRSAEKRRVSGLNARLKQAHKNRLKERAQRLFPQVKVTLANCDALLLLEYGRKINALEIEKPNQEQLL